MKKIVLGFLIFLKGSNIIALLFWVFLFLTLIYLNSFLLGPRIKFFFHGDDFWGKSILSFFFMIYDLFFIGVLLCVCCLYIESCFNFLNLGKIFGLDKKPCLSALIRSLR